MTSVELDHRQVLDTDGARALIGKLTRPDGKPVARGTLMRLIHEGLPAHQLVEGGRIHFYADEVRGFVSNRWNRRTPAHRGRDKAESEQQ